MGIAGDAHATKMMVAVDYPIPEIDQIVVETAFCDDQFFHTLAYDQRFPNVLFYNKVTKDFYLCHEMHEEAVTQMKEKWLRKLARKPLKVRFKLPKIEEEKE